VRITRTTSRITTGSWITIADFWFGNALWSIQTSKEVVGSAIVTHWQKLIWVVITVCVTVTQITRGNTLWPIQTRKLVFFAGKRGRCVNQDKLDAKGEGEKEEGKKKEGKMFCHCHPQPTLIN
jgi:hypothetical protein